MAACRSIVKKDGDSSGPSAFARSSPARAATTRTSEDIVDAFGRYGKKRPLYHNDLSYRHGPPRARWKAEDHNRRWRPQERQPFRRESGGRHDGLVHREPQHHSAPPPRREAPDRIRYANHSPHHHSSSSRSPYEHERRRDRSRSSSNHGPRTSHGRSPHDSSLQRRRSRSSSRSSCSVEGRCSNGHSQVVPRATSGHPRFTPPVHKVPTEPRRRNSGSGECRQSLSPLKKRWVPNQSPQGSFVSSIAEKRVFGNSRESGNLHVQQRKYGGKERPNGAGIQKRQILEKQALGQETSQRSDKEKLRHDEATEARARSSKGEHLVSAAMPHSEVTSKKHVGNIEQVHSEAKETKPRLQASENVTTKPQAPLRDSVHDTEKKKENAKEFDVEATPDLTEASSEEFHRKYDEETIQERQSLQNQALGRETSQRADKQKTENERAHAQSRSGEHIVSEITSKKHVGSIEEVKLVAKVHLEKKAKPQPTESVTTKPQAPLHVSASAAKKKRDNTKAVDVEAAPELRETSSERQEAGSFSLKVCSVSASVASSNDFPPGVVSESPHSVIHAEEESPSMLHATPCETNITTKPSEDTENVESMKKRDPPTQSDSATTIEKNQPSAEEVKKVVTMETSDDDTSSSEDEEEVLRWAQKMFGCTPPGLSKYEKREASVTASDSSDNDRSFTSGSGFDSAFWSDSDISAAVDGEEHEKRVPPTFKQKKQAATKKARGRPKKTLVKKGTTEKKKRGRPPKSGKTSTGRKRKKTKRSMAQLIVEAPTPEDLERARIEAEEAKRVKAEAKPPTSAELKAILADDNAVLPAGNWVRRSVRQPSRSILTAPKTRILLEKLKSNDGDMVVLKMKKYLGDPDTPTVVIDAVLDALEENTNCQSLYIQNFNVGMRDKQVLHLLKVLQRPSCLIWCLNIGETYNVKPDTWTAFANGLAKTNVTHMYASEHTISASQKEQIRQTIRINRQKHDMHKDPDNLDVIIQCTHCWWNPVNTKALRPYLQKRGFEHILYDKEKQGLRGSNSDAPTGKCEAKSFD